MTTDTHATRAPIATVAIVESAVRRAIKRDAPERVIALRAVAEWHNQPGLRVDGFAVMVRACPTVLAVLEAISGAPEPGFLVLLTPVDELGESVLARLVDHEIRPVNRFDLVRESFGAKRADIRLSSQDWSWLGDALLDAQPPGGWPGVRGEALTLEHALRSLARERFGGDVDASAMLEWSTEPAAVDRWQALSDAERNGLADWLATDVGPVADVVLRIVRAGYAAEVVPLGLVAGVLHVDPDASGQIGSDARIRMERYLGGTPMPDHAMRGFAEVAESLWTRWSSTEDAAPRAEAAAVRAEELLAELRAEDLAALSPVLARGFDARLTALARVLNGGQPEIDLAVQRIHDHHLARQRWGEAVTAEMAQRLARWLRTEDRPEDTVTGYALAQIRQWSWVDRAVAHVWQADTARTPELRDAYSALYQRVRIRRSTMDERFAARLSAWLDAGRDPGDLLLAETLLDRVAVPVRAKAAPVIVVIDGMSAAVAAELAEDIVRTHGWMEAGRRSDGREPALAVLPSVTAYSRTSLLCGELKVGRDRHEVQGFAGFWNKQTLLVHKGGLAGPAGAKLDSTLLDAIADRRTVVGLVLNAVDESLDKGRQSGQAYWTLDGVVYLKEVLDAAWEHRRPVILTSDHGHILDRGTPVATERAPNARYRSGEPGPGEVLVRGPRVLVNDEAAVLAVDEDIRYTARHAGYHGGAALAEVIIPVQVFLPSAALLPSGWQVFDPNLHAPPWWTGSPAEPVPERARLERRRTHVQDEALLSVEEAAGTTSLGAQVVATELFAAQRGFVRMAPAPDKVAALIDAVAAAGGKLPVNAAAEAVGEPVFRMSRFLTATTRLLNIDSYPVLTVADEGRTVEINVRLLREQFLS